jgi:hypothetical protein
LQAFEPTPTEATILYELCPIIFWDIFLIEQVVAQNHTDIQAHTTSAFLLVVLALWYLVVMHEI